VFPGLVWFLTQRKHKMTGESFFVNAPKKEVENEDENQK